MTFRVLVLIAGAALTGALPAVAQKRGSIEVGGFIAYLNADNSLPVGNAIGFGGRAAVNPFPFLAIEVDIAYASKDGAKHSPLHVWLQYNVPPQSRAEVFVGVGFVRNSYTGTYSADDNGFSGQAGVRHRVTEMIAVRIDGHVDFMPNAANQSYLSTYNGNWGISLGVSALLNR